MHLRKALAVFALAVMAMCLCGVANAQQITSAQTQTQISMSVGESLSLSCTPASIALAYSAGSATASGPVTCNYVWALANTRTQMYGYFWLGSATAALTNGTVNIPSSEIYASVGGGSVAPCTNSEGDATLTNITPGAECGSGPFGAGTINSTDLTGTGSITILLSAANLGVLPASTFTGTLYAQLESM